MRGDGTWRKYTATLATPDGVGVEAATFFLTSGGGGGDAWTLWLDGVSLFPGDAVAGLFRADLFARLDALGPSFVRFPGGNYLEGTSLATRWNWLDALGDPAARPGHYNSAWGYWTTDGLGLYEYLRLCEALGAAPQMSVYTGYSMGRPYVPLNESEPFVRAALDALEFANGDAATTKYGRQRAQMGHAAPFGLARLEVGNEERLLGGPDGYNAHYRAITKALWNRDPSVLVVASGRWEWPANWTGVHGSPCVDNPGGYWPTKARCDIWDEHYYRTPDELAALASSYDSYDRKKYPPVYVGEFAANGVNATAGDAACGPLKAALAEAAFLMGFEKNADLVRASSFAPLFGNVNYSPWAYNLVNFNASRSYTLPSYAAQRMFGAALRDGGGARGPGAVTLAVRAANLTKAVASASRWAPAAGGGQEAFVTIKALNYGPDALSARVALAGGPAAATGSGGLLYGGDGVAVDPNANVTVLAGKPETCNSLDAPDAVAPTTHTLVVGDDGFDLPLAPWSLTFVRVRLVKATAEQQLLSNKMLLLDPGINLLPVVGEMM